MMTASCSGNRTRSSFIWRRSTRHDSSMAKIWAGSPGQANGCPGPTSTWSRTCTPWSWSLCLPPAQRDKARAQAAFEAIMNPLAMIEEQLGRHAYVAGDSFTIGDIPTGCAVQRWRLLAGSGPSMPQLDAWLRLLAARPGFARHVAPTEFHTSG